MCSKSKLSVRLVAISVSSICMLFVFSGRVWTQQVKDANAQIKKLQEERLAALEEIYDVASKLFQNARVEYAEVLTAQRELLGARVAYAEKQEDRIKACDDAIKEAMHFLEITRKQKESAQRSQLAVLKAKACLFEIKIMRAKLAGE